MNNETILKMKHMKLPTFAKNYRDQLEHPELYDHMTFAERITLMVDAEYCARENNKVNRLLKFSNVPERTAHMGGIEYLPERHLNRDLLEQLRTNDYIRKGLNVMLIGATGSGKTYIACALATNACRNGYRTKFYRLNEFFSELEASRIQGIYDSSMNKLSAIPLLILDDYLLMPATAEQQQDLLILLRSRDEEKKSTILCSQVSVQGWHERLGSGGIADTLLDRLTANGYEISIDGDVSMRKKHSRI